MVQRNFKVRLAAPNRVSLIHSDFDLLAVITAASTSFTLDGSNRQISRAPREELLGSGGLPSLGFLFSDDRPPGLIKSRQPGLHVEGTNGVHLVSNLWVCPSGEALGVVTDSLYAFSSARRQSDLIIGARFHPSSLFRSTSYISCRCHRDKGRCAKAFCGAPAARLLGQRRQQMVMPGVSGLAC